MLTQGWFHQAPAFVPPQVRDYSQSKDMVFAEEDNMITTDLFDGRVEMHAFGQYTLEDCRQLENLSNYRIRFGGPIDVLMDFRGMSGCSLDAMLEQFRYARQHSRDFVRMAIVTDDQWVTWAAWMSQFLMEGDVRVFADEWDARAWLAEGDEKGEQVSTALH